MVTVPDESDEGNSAADQVVQRRLGGATMPPDSFGASGSVPCRRSDGRAQQTEAGQRLSDLLVRVTRGPNLAASSRIANRVEASFPRPSSCCFVFVAHLQFNLQEDRVCGLREMLGKSLKAVVLQRLDSDPAGSQSSLIPSARVARRHTDSHSDLQRACSIRPGNFYPLKRLA